MPNTKRIVNKDQVYAATAISAAIASIGFARGDTPVPGTAAARTVLMVVYGAIVLLALGSLLALLNGVMTGWEWITVLLLAGVCSSFTIKVLRLRRRA